MVLCVAPTCQSTAGCICQGAVVRPGPDPTFALAAQVAMAMAEDAWGAKVDTVKHHASTRGVGRVVMEMEVGIAAIQSGDYKRMHAWLQRRRERLFGLIEAA